jgi:Na+-transporting methylmalonyl-CoA/oxaloacetate decarboxylase gamma subunit
MKGLPSVFDQHPVFPKQFFYSSGCKILASSLLCLSIMIQMMLFSRTSIPMEEVMAILDEGINLLVVGLTLFFAEASFLAIYLRDTRQPVVQAIPARHHVPTVTTTLIASLILVFGLASMPPAFAADQALFSLHTNNGWEFYQVPAALEPLNDSGPGDTGSFSLTHSPPLLVDPIQRQLQPMKNLPLLTIRFRTTPHGRIPTVADRIDWQIEPSQEMVSSAPASLTTGASLPIKGHLSPLTVSKVAETTKITSR